MSYYRSPMGDYKTYGYAGDPGFLSGLWKGIKTVGKALFKPAPQVIQQIPQMAQQPWFGGGLPPAPGGTMGPVFPAVGSAYKLPFKQPNGQARGGGAAARALASCPPGTVPSGYHLAKDGSGRLVRNRRMNPANPRALRRSMRRLDGFEKLARRTLKDTHTIRRKR